MSQYISYTEIETNTDGSIFLRVEPNAPAIHVRLLGNPLRTCRFYYDKTWVYMSIDDANKLYQEHPYVFKFPPRPTYAIT